MEDLIARVAQDASIAVVVLVIVVLSQQAAIYVLFKAWRDQIKADGEYKVRIGDALGGIHQTLAVIGERVR